VKAYCRPASHGESDRHDGVRRARDKGHLAGFASPDQWSVVAKVSNESTIVLKFLSDERVSLPG
jgi:hypothetical protein